MTDNMPLWLDLFDDDEFLERLDDLPEGDDLQSWCARAVDGIIAEEEDDHYPRTDRALGDW